MKRSKGKYKVIRDRLKHPREWDMKPIIKKPLPDNEKLYLIVAKEEREIHRAEESETIRAVIDRTVYH